MAYWKINHGGDAKRAASSAPATFHDLQHALLLARGINPATLTSQPNAREGAHRRPARRKGAAPLVVVGGRSTPEMRRIAESWHSANTPGDWAKQTGSKPAAIQWALQSD